eukprot:5430110-Pyramimonas_sp.AAC.1
MSQWGKASADPMVGLVGMRFPPPAHAQRLISEMTSARLAHKRRRQLHFTSLQVACDLVSLELIRIGDKCASRPLTT